VHSRLPLAWHEQLTMLGFYLSRPGRLPLAWRNQRTVLGLAFARSASLSHRRDRRCGTGIWPDRDIAARRRDMTAPRPSLPTALPAPPRTPAGKGRLFDLGGKYPARHGLSAGGKWIRTYGPASAKGSVGRYQSETTARKAGPITGQVRDGDDCLERAPFAVGPIDAMGRAARKWQLRRCI
jgi:hypothetical protein